LFGLLKDWGVPGVLWQHWWGLNSDEGEAKANKGTLQVFYWFSLPGGWQVGGSPIPTANYVAASDIDFTVPLNLGVRQDLRCGLHTLEDHSTGSILRHAPGRVRG
jgi:hypothetical protein